VRSVQGCATTYRDSDPAYNRNMRRGNQQQIASCLALFAMLLLSFMPTLGSLRAAQFAISWVELCSQTGVKRIAVDTSGKPLASAQPPRPESHHSPEHCAYCPLQSQLTPVEALRVVTPTRSAWVPLGDVAYVTVALKQRRSATPLSRGPPA
jgi:Protein of unknown function (DUF2946)